MGEYVDVEGCRLFTEVAGRPGQPWLILSNSIAADRTMWDGQVGWLAETRRVLRYDTRGHGSSDMPAGPATFPQLVADVVAMMDHYEIEQADFLGISLGGMTGLGLALSYPERLTRLVCADARADSPDPVVKGWEERITRVSAKGLPAILAETLDRWLSPAFRAANPGAVSEMSGMILRTSVPGYVACARALQTLAYRAHLGRIVVPTLFVTGADDPAAAPVAVRDMADAVPGARFAVVPDARHLANVDNPEGFRAAIADFLAG